MPTRDNEGPGPVTERFSSGRAWLVLVAGVVAGLAAWVVGESPIFRTEAARERVNLMGQVLITETPETMARAERQWSAGVLGSLGGLLGLVLGLLGGRSRGSKAMFLGGLAGFLGGAVVGVVGPLVLMPILAPPRSGASDLTRALALHFALWGPIGLVAGAAFGLGAGARGNELARAALGGMLGALGAALVFDLLGAGVFPLAATHRAISARPETRLLACVLLGAGVSLGIHVLTSRVRDARGRPEAARLEIG